jgi:peptidoglycan/LPS O-acetylase OafA/YrhL
MTRIDVWDGWRGLAISMLLIGHFYNIRSMADDRLGVDLFFVLSGMLMSGILFEQRMPLKKFYLRRFSRIYPALFFYVVFWYAVATIVGWQYEFREIIANLTFIRTYYPADPHIWQIHVPMGHLWSLNVEEHAYVLMSLMTLFLRRQIHVALLLAALGLAAIAMSFYYYYDPDYSQGHFRIRTESAISFVFLSASYNLLKKHFTIEVPGWAPVLATAIAAVCYFYRLPQWLTFSVTPLLLGFAVNHLQSASVWFQGILLTRLLRTLGLWSYSIYLWQQPFFKGSELLPGGKATGLLLALAAGATSYYVIEQPLRKWINTRWGSRREKSASLS